MVAHLWAHQMQDHARNSGSNFYFHDEHIYSYLSLIHISEPTRPY